MANHPTRYQKLSDDMFYSLFRDSNYRRCNDAQRQELLQEAANRSAAMDRETGSAKVVLVPLEDPRIEGKQSGETIYLNSSYYGRAADNDVQRSRSGMQAVETVIHEERHHYQRQVVAGLAPATPTQRICFEANQGTEVDLPGDRKGLTYAGGSVNYGIYRAQPVECDAFRTSEERAKAIADRQITLISNESDLITSLAGSKDKKSLEQYTKGLQSRSQDAQMRFSSALFGVKDLEQETKNAFINSYRGTKLPVNSVVDTAVKAEQEQMYERWQEQLQTQKNTQAQTLGHSTTREHADLEISMSH